MTIDQIREALAVAFPSAGYLKISVSTFVRQYNLKREDEYSIYIGELEGKSVEIHAAGETLDAAIADAANAVANIANAKAIRAEKLRAELAKLEAQIAAETPAA